MTVPSLKKITVEDGSTLVNSDFFETKENLELLVTDGSHVELDLDVPTLEVEGLYGSTLKLKGDAQSIELNASFGSQVDFDGSAQKVDFEASTGAWILAEEAKIGIAKVKAKEGANVQLGEVKTLDAEAQYGAEINYKGDPILSKKGEWAGVIQSD